MLILKTEVFEEGISFSDFSLKLSLLFDDEDYSGRNGRDFISEKALREGFGSDFDYHFDLVIQRIKNRDLNLISKTNEYIIKQLDFMEIVDFLTEMSALFKGTLSSCESDYTTLYNILTGDVIFSLAYNVKD